MAKRSNTGQITLVPIGVVHNELRRGVTPPRARADRSVVQLDEDLATGLSGIEPGQAVVIVFAFHQSGPFMKEEHLRQHPEGDPARPLRGVFALRSPYRPNPLGMTTARVLEVEGNRLIVSGLDAFDGTPVLDIKLYTPWVDEPQD